MNMHTDYEQQDISSQRVACDMFPNQLVVVDFCPATNALFGCDGMCQLIGLVQNTLCKVIESHLSLIIL